MTLDLNILQMTKDEREKFLEEKKRYETQARELMMKWLLHNKISYSSIINYSNYSGLRLSLYFKKEATLQDYLEDGTLMRIKEQYLSILREIGCIEKTYDQIDFDFDSNEYIKKNYGYVTKSRNEIRRQDINI